MNLFAVIPLERRWCQRFQSLSGSKNGVILNVPDAELPHRRIKGTLGCVQNKSRYKNEEGARACCLSVIMAKNLGSRVNKSRLRFHQALWCSG